MIFFFLKKSRHLNMSFLGVPSHLVIPNLKIKKKSFYFSLRKQRLGKEFY